MDASGQETITARVSAILANFPRERRWLLPALQAAQTEIGYLPEAALGQTGAYLRVPASEVFGVATHYPEFRLKPRGRHHLRVCTGVTCALLGGTELLTLAARHFGVTPGETGADRELTLEAADCFFECSVAPLIEVDGVYHGRVGADDIARVSRWFRAGSPPHGRAPSSVPSVDRQFSPGAAERALGELVAAARRRRTRTRLRLLVGMGTCGRAVGADALLAAVRHAVERQAIGADVIEGACHGMCYATPLIEIQREGWPRFLIERLGPAQVPTFMEQLSIPHGDFSRAGMAGVVWADAPWRGLVPAAEHPFWKNQERVLLERSGRIDPEDLDDALLEEGYAALARALDRSPEDVIASVKAAGLQGRGGAFFPTAVKWEACRKAGGAPKYVVMNGEEGEPGIFKDRHLMEGDPHQVLEGVLLAAFAAGATRAILYVHGEAHLSAARLARAVDQARAAGIIGERILGRDVACEVELRRGAGGFVLGEETALLESIEGRRAQPRTRPPFPVESGLWGNPTVINNVETLAAIPAIVSHGGAWFVDLGTPKAPGTKVFGLSGPLRRPGVVEVRHGVTLRTLLEEIGGGTRDGEELQGALVGGPSGAVVPASLFDVPMEPRERVSPGTGGIVAIPARVSIVDVVKILLRFNANESCGKCTPCREGAPRLLEMIDELSASSDRDGVLRRVRDLADTMQLASLCGLGQAAPLAVLRGLEAFPDQFFTREIG